MFIDKKRSFPFFESIIAFVVFILHYTRLFDITIYTASPFIILPLCIAVAIYRGELTGLIFSTVCGIACDAVASGSVCFNTLVFMFTGFFVGILAKNIFNRNFRGAIALSLIASICYFALKWCFFYLLPDVQGKVYSLLWHIAPSALYTAIFIIPFYYLEKWLHSERKPKGKLIIK